MAKDTWAIIGALALLVTPSTGWVLRDIETAKSAIDALDKKVDQLSGAVGNLQQRATLLDGRMSEDAIVSSHKKSPDVEAVRILINEMIAKGTLTQARASAIVANLEAAR